MKQFGIMTPALNSTPCGINILKNLNKIIEEYTYVDPIVFYREYYPIPITPLFSIMQEVEMWAFPHPVIATNLDTAQRLLKSPCPTKKFLYVVDLEWTTMERKSYDFLHKIYTHDDIELVANSKQEAKLLHECWKEPVAIVEDFNYKQILELIS